MTLMSEESVTFILYKQERLNLSDDHTDIMLQKSTIFRLIELQGYVCVEQKILSYFLLFS